MKRRRTGSEGSVEEISRLARVGHLVEAEAVARALLNERPRDGRIWNDLGGVLLAQGRAVEAEDAWLKTLEVTPGLASAQNNLATLLLRKGDTAGAIRHLEWAAKLQPDSPVTLSNLGAAYRQAGRLEEAVSTLRAAVKLAPNYSKALVNLGATFNAQGLVEKGIGCLEQVLAADPTDLIAQDNLLFNMHYSCAVTPERCATAHRRYGEVMGTVRPEGPSAIKDPDPERRLRVGLVSPDLRRHPVAFFLEPLLEHRRREELEVFAYSNGRREDEVTVRLRALCDAWRRIDEMADEDAVEMIRGDGIDVLIDLAGHTDGNRLGIFAVRAAPVQMTYLGYPDTTGLRTVDYRLTDRWADPPGEHDALHTEEILYMEDGFLCYRPPRPCPEVRVGPAVGGAPFTFGSFNELKKISDETLSMWREVLERTPGSRLMLKNRALSDPETRERLLRRMEERGIVRGRALCVGFVPDYHGHLDAYGMVDLSLDTYPYHGTTTTCDALWMGVPVVTLAGPTHVSRVGVSLLSRLGLNELVAEDPAGYVDLAARLALDPGRLGALRAGMRERIREAGLVDGPRMAASFAMAIRRAWRARLGRELVAETRLAPRDVELGPKEAHLPDPESRWQWLPGGVRIATPASRSQMTCYVIEEQGDWFEDEVHFVRAMLRSGDRVIDAGANHGAYALAMARRVGPGGRIYAFEPAALTAGRLRASADANGFTQLEVIQAAVSDEIGEAVFHTGVSSELSSLCAANAGGTGASERVRLTTIDRAAADGHWSEVSFIKLDVEGEEIRALEGARRVLRRDDPLLMVEHKHGPTVNSEMYRWLEGEGYRIFRLLPGLNMLLPHPPGEENDPFLLNTFAVGPRRAERLETEGFLARRLAAEDEVPEEPCWREVIGSLPAMRRMVEVADFGEANEFQARHRLAIERYGLALRRDLPAGVRARCLKTALDLASSSLGWKADLGRLMTFSRLAMAWGARGIAVESLTTAAMMLRCNQGKLSEPFLPPCPRFDTIDPGRRLGAWVLSAVQETLERARAYSSYFTLSQPGTLKDLELLEGLGFQGSEMARRLQLVREATGNAPASADSSGMEAPRAARSCHPAV